MCICGNEREFSECCQAIIELKREALCAEELMRSRYSAYVIADGAYLVFSTTKENRYNDDIALIEEFSRSVEWLKLHVLQSSENMVEFKAYYRDRDGIQVLHEKSNFVIEDGVWKYKDGTLYNSKIERNESCPCGSRKKFKKCCGK